MKKNRIAIALTAFALALTATTGFAIAKSQDKSVAATETAEESINLNGKTIIMRTFFGGYVVDDDDIDNIKAASQRTDIDTKDLKEMLYTLENGQRYEDSKLGCTYVLVRKPGNENVTFELPVQNPKFYYLVCYF